jgi:hypothetical protein
MGEVDTHLSTGTSKKPWICDACKSIVYPIHVKNRASYRCGTETHNKVVTSRALQHVCYKLCGDGRATLVLFVLARIGEKGDHGGDPPRAGNFACVNHDAEFHERGIDRVAAGLDYVDVILADRFEDSDRRFANRVTCNLCFRYWKTDSGRWKVRSGTR